MIFISSFVAGRFETTQAVAGSLEQSLVVTGELKASTGRFKYSTALFRRIKEST
jgi:hypothetical protein